MDLSGRPCQTGASYAFSDSTSKGILITRSFCSKGICLITLQSFQRESQYHFKGNLFDHNSKGFLDRAFCPAFILASMAVVGPLGTRWPPVALHCDHCQIPVMSWRCYRCGGSYCGRCIFLHGLIPDMTPDVVANWNYIELAELAEGMHAVCWRWWQRLASEAACDPAEAAAGRAASLFGTCG